LGWFGLSNLSPFIGRRDELSSSTTINAVVERIIGVESNGNLDAKNGHSSATGPGQFLNETWLELIRTYRPDLAKGRSESKILELRRDTKLVREIATRFVERNASMLRRRGLPVTAGTVYLAHFAGGAGAVAILSAPDSADAALVMARADASISDIAFKVAARMSFGILSRPVQTAIRRAPTLLTALHEWCRLAPVEDPLIRFWLERDGHEIKVCSTLPGAHGVRHFEHEQCLQNYATILIVRQFVGPDWMPTAFAFESSYTPSDELQCLQPNTRFFSGEKSSWINVPVSLLSLPHRSTSQHVSFLPALPSSSEYTLLTDATDIISTLDLMLPTYLEEACPKIEMVAEIAGTSVRTLQRELTSAGISYSQIIDRARFRKSTKLLRSSDTKIIDVAMATGYADPAHFTRAFRRMAGVTPREFRSGSEDAGSKTVGDDGTYSTSTRPMRGDHGHNADRRN
jgi:AraC-like DNA-binding protein